MSVPFFLTQRLSTRCVRVRVEVDAGVFLPILMSNIPHRIVWLFRFVVHCVRRRKLYNHGGETAVYSMYRLHISRCILNGQLQWGTRRFVPELQLRVRCTCDWRID